MRVAPEASGDLEHTRDDARARRWAGTRGRRAPGEWRRACAAPRALVGVVLLVAAAGAAGAAAAQPRDPSTDRRARLHFESGTAYYDAGDYENALREFRSAFELSRRPQLHYNLYLAHERLGQLPEAIASLERFLAEVPNAENRANLEMRLANLRARAARAAGAGAAGSAGAGSSGAGGGGATTGSTGSGGATTGGASDGGVGARGGGDPAAGGGLPLDPDRDRRTVGAIDVGPVGPDGSQDGRQTGIAPRGDADGAGSDRSGAGDADRGDGHGADGGSSPLLWAGLVTAGVGAAAFGTFGLLALAEDGSLASRCGADAGRTCDDDALGTLRTYTLLADVGLGVLALGGMLALLGAVLGGGDEEAATARGSRGARVHTAAIGLRPGGATASVGGTF